MKKHSPFVLIFLLCSVLLIGCQKNNVEQSFPMQVEVGSLSAQNQLGEQLALENLKGSIWIANFIFTNCDTVCFPMTANMAKLQSKLKENGFEDVKLISFSIDPENDTVAVLKEYSDHYEANHTQWSFLTGYTLDEIESFANISFQSPAAKAEGNQFVHGTSFYLVSEEGILLKQYEGVSNPPYDEIIEDIKKLK